MKKIVGILALSFVFAVPGPSWAQQRLVSPPKSEMAHAGRISFLRCGFFVGRSGIAFGPTGYCELNPLQYFGVYGLMGHSGVDGYRTRGVTAGAHDLSAGIGFVVRSPEMKRFRLGGFAQALYSGSRVRGLYHNRAGRLAEYRRRDSDSVVTLGVEVEWRINRSMWLLARPGKNLHGGLAANTAGGFYFTAGVLADPTLAARTIRRGLRKVF